MSYLCLHDNYGGNFWIEIYQPNERFFNGKRGLLFMKFICQLDTKVLFMP